MYENVKQYCIRANITKVCQCNIMFTPKVSRNMVYIREIRVRKAAKIRNRYFQVPHLSQDTKWESNKIKINITKKSREVSPFPSGDHKAAINRSESMKYKT